jgi:DNA-binding transcriptional LysR family regulator
MAMELDHVEAFLAIVRRGGFTRASASLHLSQPAISRRIDLLERELGAPLFERIRTGVVLTEAGRAFLSHAEAALASLRDGVSAVEALRGTGRGAVTLAIVGTLASTTLTACLRRFRDAHPAVELRLRTALSAEVSALVRRGDATLGLRYRADADPDVVSTAIHDEPMLPVCSPRHRLARARRLEPRALAGEPWIAFPPHRGAVGEPYSSALDQRLAAAGLAGAEIIAIDSLTAQKRMVEAGFGLALLPASSVDEELRTGTLTVLRAPALRTTIPVVLIHRRRAFHSGATRALIAALTAWPSQPSSESPRNESPPIESPAARARPRRSTTRRAAARSR